MEKDVDTSKAAGSDRSHNGGTGFQFSRLPKTFDRLVDGTTIAHAVSEVFHPNYCRIYAYRKLFRSPHISPRAEPEGLM